MKIKIVLTFDTTTHPNNIVIAIIKNNIVVYQELLLNDNKHSALHDAVEFITQLNTEENTIDIIIGDERMCGVIEFIKGNKFLVSGYNNILFTNSIDVEYNNFTEMCMKDSIRLCNMVCHNNGELYYENKMEILYIKSNKKRSRTISVSRVS